MTILENTFLCKLLICLLFIREQQQRLRICWWQYHIRNRLTGLTYDNLWKYISMYIIDLFAFYSGTTTKIENMLVTISLSESAYRINLWQQFKSRFHENYMFVYLYSLITTKIENMLLTILYSERLTRLTYDNLWNHI